MQQTEQWKWMIRMSESILCERITHISTFICKLTTKHTLTLSEKVQLIRENENDTSYRTLAENYKISIGSVSNIIKRKAEYIEPLHDK